MQKYEKGHLLVTENHFIIVEERCNMKRTRKSIALAIALVICLSFLASCAPKQEPSSPPPSDSSTPSSTPAPTQSEQPSFTPTPTGEDVKYAEELDIILANSNIAVIDPFNPSGGVDACSWVYNLIYDRLAYPLFEGGYEPYLATRWETEDAQTYTFYLRDDVTFHNGEKFTAKDVVFTIETALASPGSSANNNWKSVAEANIIDDYTLELVLNGVNVDFIHDVSQPYCGIVNEKAMTDDPVSGMQVGTGAFEVTNFVTNNSVELTFNEKYWGEPVITKKLNMQFVPEQSSRAIMMLNGEAQLCFRVSDEDIPTFKDDPDFQLFSFPLATPNVIFFNLNDPIVGDPNFRMAVASALHRDDLTFGAVGEYGIPITDGTVWGWDTDFRNNDIPLVPYDLEKAKEYLALSPYNGEEIEIATAIASTIKASEIIQQQLAKIGINIVVNAMDTPSLGAYTQWDNNQSQIVVFSILFSRAATSFGNTVSPRTSGNRMMYDNPVINDMLDKAATSTDENVRRELYMEMQEILAEDMPYLGLFWRMSSVVAAKGVGGFKLPANALYDLRYIYQQID